MKIQLAESKNFRFFRIAFASTLLVLLISSGPAVLYKLLMRFGPRNLLATFPDNPLIWFPLLLTAELSGVVLLLISACLGAIVWLLLMKFLFSKIEIGVFLGLDIGKNTRSKRLVKRLVEMVY